MRGYKPLELTDQIYSPDGVSPRTLAAATGLKAIGDILFNPFAPANLDRIDIDVDVDYKADVAEIVGVSLNSDELEPGSRPNLYVTLRPYAGQEYVKAIPFDVPRALAGQTVKVVVTAGNLAKPDVAPPENLGGLIDNLRKSYAGQLASSSASRRPTRASPCAAASSPICRARSSTRCAPAPRPGAPTPSSAPRASSSRCTAIMQGKQEITIHVKDDPSE